jgi:hypothetical protein
MSARYLKPVGALSSLIGVVGRRSKRGEGGREGSSDVNDRLLTVDDSGKEVSDEAGMLQPENSQILLEVGKSERARAKPLDTEQAGSYNVDGVAAPETGFMELDSQVHSDSHGHSAGPDVSDVKGAGHPKNFMLGGISMEEERQQRRDYVNNLTQKRQETQRQKMIGEKRKVNLNNTLQKVRVSESVK